jgi:lipoate-protein ligase B
MKNRFAGKRRCVQFLKLGLTDFSEAYELQKKIREEVSSGSTEDTVIITEHRPVITIGRGAVSGNLKKTRDFLAANGIRVIKIDRGGGVTYHGPGQIVGYAIFKLRNEARDIHAFLEYLEDVGINFLRRLGLRAYREKGKRGVWACGKKIGSIGIGVKKWTTYHGLALNINNDLKPFSYINPCGMNSEVMSSVRDIKTEEIDIGYAVELFADSFKEVPFLAETVGKV